MTRPTFAVQGVLRQTRDQLGDAVIVHVTHYPGAFSFQMSEVETERLIGLLQRALEDARSERTTTLFMSKEEPTRRQCSACFNDCSACVCAANRAGKGA